MLVTKKILILVLLGSVAWMVKNNINKQEKETVPIEIEEKQVVLPQEINLKVPFVAQAPLGNWNDVKQGNGCEEASIIMAYSWTKGEKINPQSAVKEIVNMSNYSLKLLGHFHDISNEDTLRLFREYFKFENAYLEKEVSLETIKNNLAEGKILIVAVNGDKINNPNYQIPKPANHKIVVVGYDEINREFITNDPGTSKGEAYRYKYDQLLEAITDYPTGYRESFDQVFESMIVVKK